MEISPVPFLGLDDESLFYGFSPAMDDFDVFDDSPRKRSRRDGEMGDEEGSGGFDRSVVRNMLSSFIMEDEDEKKENNRWFVDCQQDKSFFHGDQSELGLSGQLKTKRPRRTASPATAAAAGSDTASSGTAAATENTGQHRRLWVIDRSKDWWEKCNHPDFPEEEFRRAFRMSKSTFDMICRELDSAVGKRNTTLRDAIPVRQRVAVCIWRLATGEPLRLVSKRFGLGISTCHKLVLEVCSAIKTVLMPMFIQWPEERRMKKTKDEFEAVSGISNVGGTIYTTHIPIIAPKVNVGAYYNKKHTERNQKTSYSVTVQGVVDSRGIFSDICIGWPGSMSDDKILEKSALYERSNRGLLKDVWIVGNSGYPLMDWLLVPYTRQNLTWSQHAFNEKLEDIQKTAMEAFSRLKGRWSCLQKRTEVKLQELPVVLGACCVLHNICEMNNEEMDSDLRFQIFDDEMMADNNLRPGSAIKARDHIAHNLLHHGLAGTSFYSHRLQFLTFFFACTSFFFIIIFRI